MKNIKIYFSYKVVIKTTESNRYVIIFLFKLSTLVQINLEALIYFNIFMTRILYTSKTILLELFKYPGYSIIQNDCIII